MYVALYAALQVKANVANQPFLQNDPMSSAVSLECITASNLDCRSTGTGSGSATFRRFNILKKKPPTEIDVSHITRTTREYYDHGTQDECCVL
jgi:hypothetical protein